MAYGTANTDVEGAPLLNGQKESFWARNGKKIAMGLTGVAGVLMITTIAFGVQANAASSTAVTGATGMAAMNAAPASTVGEPRQYLKPMGAVQAKAMDAIPPTTTYTWVITSVKGNREDAKKCATANCVVQANEVVFYDTDGNELGGEYHTATVTGDAGVVTKPSEGPDKLFDMKTNTKFLDSAFAFETSITFEFPFEIALGGMAFLTGGEWIARDPDSWKVYAHYETGDEEVQNIEMAGVTDDRLALTKMFPFTAPAGGAMEPGSIVNDSPVANLDGWTKVYEEVYGAYTVLGDIELCNGYDNIFVGAKANVGADHIILGASESYSFVDSLSAQTCDKAAGFKNPDSPDGAYWHNCVDWSFGFTPTQIVQLNSADVYDMSDENRLSWHLHGWVGGFRIGTIGWINNDQTYAKVIYCK